MPVLNVNIRTLNSYVESPKLLSSYFMASACKCMVFFLQEQNTAHTNGAVFISLLVHTLLPMLYLQLPIEKGRAALSFPFLWASFPVQGVGW